MTTQTFRCLERVADLILLRAGEEPKVNETFANAVERETLEFEARIKSEWEYKSMITICQALTQSLKIKNEVEVGNITKRTYVFEDNNGISFILMRDYISIYGSVPKTAVSAYDNRSNLFAFKDGEANPGALYNFFNLKVDSEDKVDNAKEELLKLFSCYKKPPAEYSIGFVAIWYGRAMEFHGMVMNSNISQDVRENAIKSWLSGLNIEEKVRACQYMYDNLPNRGMYEMGKDVLALYCKKHKVAIKTLYSGW